MKTNTTLSVLGILSGIAIILSVIAIAMHVSEDIVVDNISIVLGFIGVLATFIVVTNYVQVGKLEHKIEYLESQVVFFDKQRYKLHTMHKRVIFTIVDSLMSENIDKAFFYMQDILPILSDLYGENGKRDDFDNEKIQIVMHVLDLLLDQHEQCLKDKEDGIKPETLKDFLADMKQYMPKAYYKIPEVKKVCNRITNLVKELSKEQ